MLIGARKLALGAHRGPGDRAPLPQAARSAARRLVAVRAAAALRFARAVPDSAPARCRMRRPRRFHLRYPARDSPHTCAAPRPVRAAIGRLAFDLQLVQAGAPAGGALGRGGRGCRDAAFVRAAAFTSPVSRHMLQLPGQGPRRAERRQDNRHSPAAPGGDRNAPGKRAAARRQACY